MSSRKRTQAEKRRERIRYRQRAEPQRQALYRQLKDKPCADCGVRYPPHVMSFDHLPEHEKRKNVSDCNSFESIRSEAAKCDVVCHNCHAERSYRRMVEKRAVADSTRDLRQLGLF